MFISVLRLVICTLFVARAYCYDGLARRPEVISSTQFIQMVPLPLTTIVNAHLGDHYFCPKGLAKCRIEPNHRQQIYDLIVTKLIEEFTRHTKLYINFLLDERQILNEPDDATIVKKLDTVQRNVGTLSGFLGFLYDHGAEFTELMDTYLLLSDISTVYRRSSSKENFVSALKAKACEPSDCGPTVGVHQELFKKFDNSFYQLTHIRYCVNPKLWMTSKTLKWKQLMESKLKEAELIQHKVTVDSSNLTFQQWYDQIIVVSTDSQEVFRFYTQVSDAVTDMVVDAAAKILGGFIQLLRLLASNKGKGLSPGQTELKVSSALPIIVDLEKVTGIFIQISKDYHLTRPENRLGKSFCAVLKIARNMTTTKAKLLTTENMRSMAADLEETANKILKIRDSSKKCTVTDILEDMRKTCAQTKTVINIIRPFKLY